MIWDLPSVTTILISPVTLGPCPQKSLSPPDHRGKIRGGFTGATKVLCALLQNVTARRKKKIDLFMNNFL
jgi:hypothetical protein